MKIQMIVSVCLLTASILMQPVKVKESETFTAYAYCPCVKCCGKSDEITKSGTIAAAGRTIAVDPDIIPIGSEMWIDGIGPYMAEDTGSGIDGYKIDVFMSSHEAALQWGKQKVQIEWTTP